MTNSEQAQTIEPDTLLPQHEDDGFPFVEINTDVPPPAPIPDGIITTEVGEFTILTPVVSGKKNGVMQVFQNKRLLMESTYTDDIQHGALKIYYPNQSLQALGSYTNNALNGPYTTYHTNGKTQMSMVYVNGQQNGPMKVYDEQGALVQQATYVDGVLNGYMSNYYDGDEISKIFYKDGVELKNPSLSDVA
jgi:antitoxin component YwqK of YwqJK toxin-antitoxin module